MDCMSYNFIKVKKGNSIKFVKIIHEYDILHQIFSQFNCQDDEEITIQDQDGADISEENLPFILQQYSGCSCFILHLISNSKSTILEKTNVHDSGDVLSSKKTLKINSETLTSYLQNGDYSYIFTEYAKNNTLTGSSRRNLVREAIHFLRKIAGNYPKKEEKIALAEAIINIFPSYKVMDSKIGGYELFFNPSSNSGYIVAKLKNLNLKRRRMDESKIPSYSAQYSDAEDNNEESLRQEDLEFFANCVVDTQREEIRNRLKSTLKARIKFCTGKADVLLTFPLFFYDPSLIAFDFELRYGERAQSLLKMWSQFATHAEAVVQEAVGSTDVPMNDWGSEIKPFLFLLKLLPSVGKPGGRTSFENSISRFIQFQNLSTPNQDNGTSKHPKLIIVGPNKLAKSRYLLAIDSKVLSLPTQYSFAETFDIYFKSFYILNIEFEQSLSLFLKFFAKFIYKIDESATSPSCLEVYVKFQNKINAVQVKNEILLN